MIDWNEGQILFDDLKLEKVIGAGAFGEVWRARQLSWDCDVAVKRVKAADEARIRSMEKEAIHWLEIGLHPYVTTCYYTRRYEGVPVLVLEFAREGALDNWIKDERLLFEENATELIIKFGLEAAWGLACAHRTGMLHLDVKPANILIENGHAKITDFGIASRLGDEFASSGTRAFAPPEQLSRKVLSDKTDVFSWAVTLFALFKHEVSWSVGIAASEVMEDSRDKGELPLYMPDDVYRLLRLCMEEDPGARPTIEEASDDLLYILRTEYPEYPAPAEVVERQPLTAAEYNNRAVYMYETGDVQGAAEYFRMAEETAADVTVPHYNRSLIDFYAGHITPGKMLEDNLNRGLGKLAADHLIAARIFMLNGDARSIKENPDVLSASSSARNWIESGAPGSLRFQEPHEAEYMQEGDREAIKRILTQGGLSKWNNKSNKLPVDMIVSPERKAMMMDNDKGAFLLGGLNSGAKPWVTMMLNRENLKLDIAQFIGENAVIYLDGSLKICDFSDPENLIFSGMPDTPELRALGDVSIIKVESLGKVSCMSVLTGRRNYAVLILDLTDGIRSAKVKVIAIEDKARSPEIAFFGDGTVLINAHQKVCPEEWGGIKRETAEPAKLMPSNNTSAPIARIAGNFGSGTTLVRHSMEYRSISTTEEIRSFEFSCLWKFAPYSFLAMAFDNSPASGGSVMLHFEGDFFIARIDRDDVSPPDRAEWLMMKAVSGEVAKKRRETISNAASEYERILKDGDYGRIGSLCASLRTLVENRDENAFALWQRIQRDFPRGKPFMAVECEAKPPEKEFLYHVKHAKPVYPSMPFSHPSAIGKIKYSYNYRNEAQALIVSNKVSFPLEISAVGEFRIVTAAEPSGDGLFQALFYSRSGEDERLIVGRKGVLVRVIDVKGPECVFELVLPSLQIQEIFVRWYYHTMLIYVGSFGIFHIDFDEPGAPDSKLPPPIIPELTELHDVFFIGEHADDLFTGENRFRLCFEVLPFPSNPMNDERLNNFLPVLPKKPDERRAVLLANGFGNLWTERILREKPR